METLLDAIDHTPIIDHHAHNLLLPDELAARPLLTITSPAESEALSYATSTTSHFRAVQQLSKILGCADTWDDVQAAIVKKRKEPDDAWARRCFDGIETALIDDGLDGKSIHPYNWHNGLTRSKCKRIVRIETVAETILKSQLAQQKKLAKSQLSAAQTLANWQESFTSAIQNAIQDPEVVGFKSVICYRTGLALPGLSPTIEATSDLLIPAMERVLSTDFNRLADRDLSPFFVHATARLISQSKGHRKPFQFHTGLGDNEITLSLASPSHLQPFIKQYPKVPIVLLHASYPFTKEAGYLASTYENVYLDIGEVFPLVSQEGQESVIRESLELCPSEKLFWSTDGHWFPETYLLAVIQVREAMKQVLCESVARKSVQPAQSVKIVEDIFFNTANRVYNLGLSLNRLGSSHQLELSPKNANIANVEGFIRFLDQNSSVKFLRLQWLDYTATLRARIIPKRVAVDMFSNQKSIGITNAVFGLLQQDQVVEGFPPIGEYELIPCFEGLRLAERDGYAIVQGEFREKGGGAQVPICPRTALRRIVEVAKKKKGISFLVGFELEVVFMTFEGEPLSHAHSWSNTSALRNPEIMDVLEEIVVKLERSKIKVEQFHPESAPGQYELVTGPLPPLQSVDALLAARDIICAVAEKHKLRATFIPKPFPNACGTGAHVHISMTPDNCHKSFYAGVLAHLRSILAFTYCNPCSYERMQDSVWSGGQYVTWGSQNRETPLRKIEDSHWEFRCMDGFANSYLALAAILGAGVKGVMDERSLTLDDCQADPALLDADSRRKLGIVEMLPKTFDLAMTCLDEDDELREVLGDKLVDTHLAIKGVETEMLKSMNDEERRKFLLERY